MAKQINREGIVCVNNLFISRVGQILVVSEMLANFLSKTIKLNPYQLTLLYSYCKHSIRLSDSRQCDQSQRHLLINKSHFNFATVLPASSKIPDIYHLRKHANSLKLQSKSPQQYIQTLHQLSTTLASYYFLDQAIQTAQQMLNCSQQTYLKSTQQPLKNNQHLNSQKTQKSPKNQKNIQDQKNPKNYKSERTESDEGTRIDQEMGQFLLQESNLILNHKCLVELYKANKKYDKYFSCINSLIEFMEKIILKQINLTPLLCNLYLEVGFTHFQLGNLDLSKKMIQTAISKSTATKSIEESLSKDQNFIKAKTILGHVLAHQDNKIDEALKILTQNLTQILQKPVQASSKTSKVQQPKTKSKPNSSQPKESSGPSINSLNQPNPPVSFGHQTISGCIYELVKVLTFKLPNIDLKETKEYLRKITPLTKSLQIQHADRQIQTQHVLEFYQKLAKLYIHIHDYIQAIECYRVERDHIPQNQLQNLALCYQNQAKVLQLNQKLQKAIQKLNRCIEKREQIQKMYGGKKRKSAEEQKILAENKSLILQNSRKLVELYKAVKNTKKAQLQRARYEDFQKW